MEVNNDSRDYVTGVAFNLSLSRNQIAVFSCIVWEIAYQTTHGRPFPGLRPNSPSHFVSAARKLSRMGLVKWTDPSSMTPSWSRCVWKMTPAGELTWGLLLQAGMVSKPRVPVDVTEPAEETV